MENLLFLLFVCSFFLFLLLNIYIYILLSFFLSRILMQKLSSYVSRKSTVNLVSSVTWKILCSLLTEKTLQMFSGKWMRFFSMVRRNCAIPEKKTAKWKELKRKKEKKQDRILNELNKIFSCVEKTINLIGIYLLLKLFRYGKRRKTILEPILSILRKHWSSGRKQKIFSGKLIPRANRKVSDTFLSVEQIIPARKEARQEKLKDSSIYLDAHNKVLIKTLTCP